MRRGTLQALGALSSAVRDQRKGGTKAEKAPSPRQRTQTRRQDPKSDSFNRRGKLTFFPSYLLLFGFALLLCLSFSSHSLIPLALLLFFSFPFPVNFPLFLSLSSIAFLLFLSLCLSLFPAPLSRLYIAICVLFIYLPSVEHLPARRPSRQRLSNNALIFQWSFSACRCLCLCFSLSLFLSALCLSICLSLSLSLTQTPCLCVCGGSLYHVRICPYCCLVFYSRVCVGMVSPDAAGLEADKKAILLATLRLTPKQRSRSLLVLSCVWFSAGTTHDARERWMAERERRRAKSQRDKARKG